MNTMTTVQERQRGRPDARAVTDLVSALTADYGERAVTSRAVRDQHGHGEGLADTALPDIVVFPHTNDEVAAIVRLCHAARVPVIAFGVGTSLEGHVAALYGGVCVDLSQMNRVLEINADDLDCRVQAGVTREQVNAELKGTGLFFPIDPGANATIGGMAATRASGTNAVRYGTMRENVLGLTVVTPEGKIIHTGGRARKSSAGYDLTRLYVGAEGTLGIITEIQLRLYGVPEAMAAAVCQFEDLEGAVRTVITAMQMGIPVARIELLDDVQMDACIRYSKLTGFAAKPTLFFEFHGSEAGVAEQSAQMQALTVDHGGGTFEWATRPEDRTRLWKARHAAYYAAMALTPGKQGFATDACVPISRLADCIMETKADVVGERARRTDRRTRGRRQFSPGRAVRPERSGGACECRDARQTGQPARDRDGRHLHRRARHRRAQARRAGRRARRGGRRDARDQARARSPQHHESGQDRARVAIPLSRCIPSTSATRITRRGRCAAGWRCGSPARRSRK